MDIGVGERQKGEGVKKKKSKKSSGSEKTKEMFYKNDMGTQIPTLKVVSKNQDSHFVSRSF